MANETVPQWVERVKNNPPPANPKHPSPALLQRMDYPIGKKTD